MVGKLWKIIQDITLESFKLKNKYIKENMQIDWVCIFTHSNDEFSGLLTEALTLGDPIENTVTCPIYQFSNPPETPAGKPKLLKIRKPDLSKNERGDVDYTSNYLKFKKKYLGTQGFTLIKRSNFEMIELVDNEFNVRDYFSSIPPSKLRGVNA